MVEIPAKIREGLKMVPVSHVDGVLELALSGRHLIIGGR